MVLRGRGPYSTCAYERTKWVVSHSPRAQDETDLTMTDHSWPADWPNFSQPIANDKEAPFDSAELILNWFLEPKWQDRYW